MKTIGSRLTAENSELTDSRESVLRLHAIRLNVTAIGANAFCTAE